MPPVAPQRYECSEYGQHSCRVDVNMCTDAGAPCTGIILCYTTQYIYYTTMFRKLINIQ